MPVPKGTAREQLPPGTTLTNAPTAPNKLSGESASQRTLISQIVKPDQFQLPLELESRIRQYEQLWKGFVAERTRLADLLNTLLISQFAGRYHEIYWPNRPETRYAVKLFEDHVWVDFLQLYQRKCQAMETRTMVKVKKGKKKQTSSHVATVGGQRVTAAAATSSAASSTTSTPTRTLQRPSAAVKMEDSESAPTHVVRSSPKTKQRFTIEGGLICEQWFIDHIHDPYPSDADKEGLACRANVHYDQISSWFINARMRKWQKLLAQVQKGQVKQTAQMNEEEKQNQREIAERIKNKEATVRPLTRVSLKGKAKNRSAVDELNEATAAAATAMANIRRSTRQPKPVQYHESEIDLNGGEYEVDDDATEVDLEHDDEVEDEEDQDEIEQFENDSMSDAFSGTTEGGNEVASSAAASTAVPELYSTSSSQLLSFHLSSTMSMAGMASMNDLQATTTLLSEPQVAGGLSDSGLVPSDLSTPGSNKSTPTQTLTSSQQQPLQANHMFLMPRLAGSEDQPHAGVLSTVDMMRLSTTGPQPMMMSTGLTNQWQINTPPQTSLIGLARDGVMLMQPMSLSSASPFMMPLVHSVDMNGVGMMGYVPSNSNDINLIGLPAFNMAGFASFQSPNSSMSVPPPIVEDSNQTHSATNNSNDGATISNGGVIRITPATMGPRVKTESR